MKEWIDARGGEKIHEFTQGLLDAIIREERH
jgi:hypothetical protein